MDFYLEILGSVIIFAMLAVSLNYLIGNVGILSLGHYSFFAVGSYSTAIFITNSNLIIKFLPITISFVPILSIIVGLLITFIFSLIFGFATLRLSGHYLLIVTLGLCEIVRSVANNSVFAGAADGLSIESSLLPFVIVSQKVDLFSLMIMLLIAEVTIFYLLEKSPAGRLFKAVRDNPILLLSLGFNVNYLKIKAFIITSLWASLAGSLFALFRGYIEPNLFTVVNSLILLVGIIIGGVSSFKGSFLAAIIIVVIPALLRDVQLPNSIISPMHQILFALLILIILKFRPKGITGKVLLK